MKQKINLRLIGIAVIAVLATAIGITFIYYGLFKKQVQAGLRTNAEVLMETGVFEKSSQYADVKLPINNLRVTWIDSDGVVLFDNKIYCDFKFVILNILKYFAIITW